MAEESDCYRKRPKRSLTEKWRGTEWVGVKHVGGFIRVSKKRVSGACKRLNDPTREVLLGGKPPGSR